MDAFFQAMPNQELVADARRQVEEENEMNKVEYDEFVKSEMLNVVTK